MHRKYRKLVSAGLVLTMAGAMTLQGCGQKEKEGKIEIELVQYKPEAVKTLCFVVPVRLGSHQQLKTWESNSSI